MAVSVAEDHDTVVGVELAEGLDFVRQRQPVMIVLATPEVSAHPFQQLCEVGVLHSLAAADEEKAALDQQRSQDRPCCLVIHQPLIGRSTEDDSPGLFTAPVQMHHGILITPQNSLHSTGVGQGHPGLPADLLDQRVVVGRRHQSTQLADGLEQTWVCDPKLADGISQPFAPVTPSTRSETVGEVLSDREEQGDIPGANIFPSPFPPTFG